MPFGVFLLLLVVIAAFGFVLWLLFSPTWGILLGALAALVLSGYYAWPYLSPSVRQTQEQASVVRSANTGPGTNAGNQAQGGQAAAQPTVNPLAPAQGQRAVTTGWNGVGMDCNAVADKIGVPNVNAYPTQNGDGSFVKPWSCKIVAAIKPQGVGWNGTLPQDVVAHIWLVEPTRPGSHVAVTAVGPGIVGDGTPYRIAEMTLYPKDLAAYAPGHDSQWTPGELSGTSPGTAFTWVAINQAPKGDFVRQ